MIPTPCAVLCGGWVHDPRPKQRAGLSVLQTSGAGTLCMAGGEGRQGVDVAGAALDAVGRDRLAHAAANVATIDGGVRV